MEDVRSMKSLPDDHHNDTSPFEDRDYYSPTQAAKILRLSRRRVTQLLESGELEGEQTDSGRWRIPQRAVHDRLKDRPPRPREREGPREAAEASREAAELRDRVETLQRQLGRLEGRLELTEKAESTLREQLERERLRANSESSRAEQERQRAERLEQELARARRPWYRKLFGS